MSADPWREFVERTDGSDSCGYLEWRSSIDPTVHRSVAYRGPKETIVLRRATDWAEFTRHIERLRAYPRDSTFVGYLGFDAAALLDPAFGPSPASGPFPLGEFARVADPVRRTFPAPVWRLRPREPSSVSPTGDTLTRSQFERGVLRLQAAIRAGDAYQVVLAHRRSFRRPEDLLTRAGELRARERFAFFYYLRFGNREIVGASPESVVERAGPQAFISPIAGTRPRRTLGPRRAGLAQDAKETAEHRMLVDLARNDLGRVAEPGSVRLVFRERRERFALLEHLVSRVAARPRSGVTALALLQAAFPAGTVSGAPKIRATELLRGVEGTWRGPYGGAVGWFRPRGDCAWALAIRSAFVAAETLYTAAGAGIVIGSRPRREWQETLVKLGATESTLVGDVRA